MLHLPCPASPVHQKSGVEVVGPADWGWDVFWLALVRLRRLRLVDTVCESVVCAACAYINHLLSHYYSILSIYSLTALHILLMYFVAWLSTVRATLSHESRVIECSAIRKSVFADQSGFRTFFPAGHARHSPFGFSCTYLVSAISRINFRIHQDNQDNQAHLMIFYFIGLVPILAEQVRACTISEL